MRSVREKKIFTNYSLLITNCQPSTVDRQPSAYPSVALRQLPYLRGAAFSIFNSLSALKQTSLALRAISPNLGENELPSPKLGEGAEGG